MDRLDINYIRECNDINKLFNIITMEYTIDIMKAENKYYLESSLIKLQNDSILFENSKEKSESSSFKKHIKGIFQAIVNFIENTLESIKELFIKKKNITIDDYMNSTSGQIKIDKDMDKLKKQIDEDMNKGNQLIYKIASKVGHVSEKEVDDFIDNSKSKIKKIGPGVIIAGVVKHFTYNAIAGDFNKQKKQIKNSQNTILGSTNLDVESEGLINKVFGHLSYLAHLYGNETIKIFKKISK